MTSPRRILPLRNGCRVDLDAGLIHCAGEATTLTTTETRLLAALADHAGEIVPAEAILQQVWNRTWDGDPDALGVVRNAMFKLRRKIERDPRRPEHLTTEQGDGYRLVLDAPPPPPLADGARHASGREALITQAVTHLVHQPEPLVLMGPWRYGKTTVLRSVLRAVGGQGLAVARLDPRTFDRHALVDSARVLDRLSDELLDAVGLEPIEVAAGTPHQRLKRLMERHILPRAEVGLVLAVEDVDRLARAEEQADLLAMLRGWTEETRPVWERLRLVMTSATPPVRLTARLHLSPFNLGRTLHLDELPREAVLSLAERRGLSEPQATWLVDEVCGHPWLVEQGIEDLLTGEPDPLSRALSEVADRLRALPGGPEAWASLTGAEPRLPDATTLAEFLRLGLVDPTTHPPRPSRRALQRLSGLLMP